MSEQKVQDSEHVFDGVPLVTKKPRKQRSDKGVKRGPRKKKAVGSEVETDTSKYSGTLFA